MSEQNLGSHVRVYDEGDGYARVLIEDIGRFGFSGAPVTITVNVVHKDAHTREGRIVEVRWSDDAIIPR